MFTHVYAASSSRQISPNEQVSIAERKGRLEGKGKVESQQVCNTFRGYVQCEGHCLRARVHGCSAGAVVNINGS